jgi:hypothetical protein
VKVEEARAASSIEPRIAGPCHVAGPELRHEHLVDIGLAGMPVDWTIKHHGTCDPVVSQPRHEGIGLPVTVRGPGSEALALRLDQSQQVITLCIELRALRLALPAGRALALDLFWLSTLRPCLDLSH